MAKFVALLGALSLLGVGFAGERKPTVADALKNIRVLAIPANGRPIDRTVADEFRRDLAPHLLYALYSLLKEDWLGLDAAGFENGKVVVPRFSRLEGGDNYLANPKRVAAGYDAERSVRELARLGFSHVPVNALAKDMPAEQGPPGEIYCRFYYFSPDLDQFVETPLNAGAYSPEYLEANLALLKENARLAVKYGLTPGLNISSPRSVPDAVLEKSPYLREARVDHPFRSYRPRFTLTLSHPAVRWHYAELMRRLMREVPELGYIYLWTNDSGSGFEYTASLYVELFSRIRGITAMNALLLPPAPWEPVPTVPPSPSDGSPSATGVFRTAFTAVGCSPKAGEEPFFGGTMKLVRLTAILFVIITAAGAGLTAAVQDAANAGWADTNAVDKKDFVSAGSNTYFRLEPGYRLKLEGREGLSRVTLLIIVLEGTKLIDGVETRIVEERESKGGKLVEVSRNFFAFNTADLGVYYFGEEVDIYKDDKVIGHEGAWESGKDGARFGLMIPGQVVLGARYYQEIAPDVAMDRAEIAGLHETLKTPAGEFKDCLKVAETTPLEKGAKEYKLYAPGVGLIKDASLLLVEYGFPKT